MEANMEYNFTVILEREDEGGYHAFCPALKGCHTQGETYEEAMNNITDAINLYLESLRAHNDFIPQEDIIIKPLRVVA
jgi:predicted RNase H-like HicB family nuclease